MRKPLTVAVTQPPCAPYDVTTNALRNAAVVRNAAARVVAFPELSLTGYELDASAITPEDRRLLPLVEACAATGSVALAGAPLAGEASASHLAMLAVDGNGASVAYRKVNLAAAEACRFTAGSEPVAIQVDGWRLGLAICRDTGIAHHVAATAALGIDLYVAAILHSADEGRVQEERARRIAADHRVWVALASFAGSTGGGYDHASGRSGVWAPDGAVVAQAGPEPGAIIHATLS
ncbi:carbon-nitrogen hydrolase family protein [Frankia sp. QA3]|uniref:carbon-nitrogen hydrolase family protein n=1 Tax=Frankia sp. QA3 TaxID=710111 RepID=UPI000564126D